MTTRFKDLPWNKGTLPIIVGGAGGIGSWLSLFLSRMDHKIYLFDHDQIDHTNLSGQLYQHSQIGMSKSLATSRNCDEFANGNVFSQTRYTDECSPYMFSCFDNMEARKQMVDAWSSQDDREIFIDGRMMAEFFQIFVVTNDAELEEYLSKYMFSSDEAFQESCTTKATTHCGAMCASYMVSLFTNYLTNKYTNTPVREVPFHTTIELPLMHHEYENISNTELQSQIT